jgi:hypothetical protein
VIRLYDVTSQTTRTIGTVTTGETLGGGDPTTGTGTVYVSCGQCIETESGKRRACA